MPFPTQTPQPFTKTAIEQINPGQTGCYGIFRSGLWIYVGRGDIRDRLLSHLNGNNARITRENPTHFVTVVTNDDVNKEIELIRELDPVANRKVG